MSQYKVKESDFEVPPQNIYLIDLTGIEEMQGSRGSFLRWRWQIADVPGQEQYVGAFVTSITPITPTTNNRFGQFLGVLQGKADIGMEGSTEALLSAKYRAKAFIEHNKKEDNVYCNANKLLEAKVGVGIGPQEIAKKGESSEGFTSQPQQGAQPQAQQQTQPQAQPGQQSSPAPSSAADDKIPW